MLHLEMNPIHCHTRVVNIVVIVFLIYPLGQSSWFKWHRIFWTSVNFIIVVNMWISWCWCVNFLQNIAPYYLETRGLADIPYEKWAIIGLCMIVREFNKSRHNLRVVNTGITWNSRYLYVICKELCTTGWKRLFGCICWYLTGFGRNIHVLCTFVKDRDQLQGMCGF